MLEHELSIEEQERRKAYYAKRAANHRQKMVEKFGSWEAYIEFCKKNGSKGGKTTGKSKVRGDKEYYSQAGKKGAEKRWSGSSK